MVQHLEEKNPPVMGDGWMMSGGHASVKYSFFYYMYLTSQGESEIFKRAISRNHGIHDRRKPARVRN